MGACAHGAPRSPTGLRYPSLDEAALAAAAKIEQLNRRGQRWTFEPVEWGFNLFRDERDYFADNFHTDHEEDHVRLRIRADAIAAGHNHTIPMYRAEPALYKQLSPGDLGPDGVLVRTPLGRLPHYLVMPSGRVRVWEWQGPERRWEPRWVHRTAD